MSAKLTLKQRILTGFVLVLAFLLVLGSNLVDRRHFSTIQKTIASIHDDRVVVQDYIYQLRNFLHVRELEVFENGNIGNGNDSDMEIMAILDDFSQTKLTREEGTFLKRLHQQFSNFKSYESANMSKREEEETKSQMLDHIYKTKTILDALEEIQIEESGHLTELSEKTLRVNTMLSNLEIGFMIIIGVSILVLVFQPIKTLYPIH